MKFCGECGYGLKRAEAPIPLHYQQPHSYTPKHLVDKILTTRSAIEGERKLVTIMFADVTGFTSMSEKLDPEDVHQIMNGCFSILMDEVHRCEGTVNEFRGDGVMAIFGAPIAHEDHAHRACYASLAVQKALVPYGQELEKEFGIDFKMRIGLNSGPVVVGAIGDDLRMDYTAQGDTANLAARMETSADPGRVLVSGNTWKLVKDSFQFEPMKKMKVKGKEHLVSAYLLKDNASAIRPRPQREVYSEMIGRDQELARLELQVLKAVNGDGSVVNVIGEAGIGKSRLLAELKKREVVKRVSLVEGRAVSMGKNLSYHPIIDLLKNWARIREDDTESSASNKLETAIRRVSADGVDEIFPFVATMMGMKLSGNHADRVRSIEGEALEKLVFKNVRELLIRSTEIMPIVIVMEDLHWTDASSLFLLESIYRLALTQKVLFINLFRPGYWDTNDGIVETLKAKSPDLPVVEILIQPLDPHNSEALINNMLNVRGLHHDVKGQIVEKAGGNPFFIEEVVHSLIDEGAVKVVDRGFEVTDTIHSVVIPQTISDVLMARIDRLDEESRAIVKTASVIGRSFFYRVLADVASQVDNLDDKLAYLKSVQLFRSRMRMGELEYLFKHAMAHEAAYESTLLKQRKKIHLMVAESIERIFKDKLHEFFGMLAFHYSRGEELEKAEEYMTKAGEEALRSSASNEALHYYQEALSIYRMVRGNSVDPEKVAMFEKNIGLALFNRGHYAEAVAHFDKALNYYWGELPKNAASAALRFLSSFMTFFLALYFPSFWFKRLPTQQDTEAVDLFYKKAQALVVVDPKRFFVESFFFYDRIVHFDLTKFNLGIVIFAGASALFSYTGLSLSIGRRVLDHAKPRLAPDDAKQLVTYDLLNTIHLFLKGQWNEISEYNEDLVKNVLRIGEMWDAAMHYYWHGLPKIYQGHFDAAKLMVTRLSEIAETYENDIYRLLKYLLNIYLCIESRHINEATAEVNRGIALVQSKYWSLHSFDMHTLKASIDLLMKDTEEAGKSLDKANQIRSEVKAVPMQLSAFYRSQFEYYLCRLEESLRAGHREESSEYRRNAFRSGKMLIKICQKAASYRTESYRLMGVYKWLIHDQKGAVKWWRKAISEGESLGARPQLARTYAEMGMRLCASSGESSAPDASWAKEPLQKAQTMFHDLGLRHDLKDLNSAIYRIGLEPSEVCSPLAERQEK